MTKEQEALKLELEALESCNPENLPLYEQVCVYELALQKAITAIKEVLALTSTQCEEQPAQEK